MFIKENISDSNVLTILSVFAIGTIKNIKPLETSGNITYVVNTTLGKYILRLSPSGFRNRSKNEILGELELIEHLTKKSILSLTPVAKKNGETLVSWEKHYGYLREFNKGRERTNLTLRDIELFGEWLGEFHSSIEGFSTKHKRVHRWDVNTTKKNFVFDKEIILKSSFPNKKLFLKKMSNELSKINFLKNLPKGTIHEDLGKRHVLWKKEKIVGVIDFDRAYYGELVLDLGQACRGWCFREKSGKWSMARFKALIPGYQKHRKITDLENKNIVDAIQFGILERSLSFALRFTTSNDAADAEYANFSLNFLTKDVEENRNAIENVLKHTTV